MVFRWTLEMDAKLTALHAQDSPQLLFRNIADELNEAFRDQLDHPLTRYACIGRSHRLKLPLRVYKDKSSCTPINPAQQIRVPRGSKMITITPIEPLEEYGPPRPEGKTFAQLNTYRECHWPLGPLLEPAKLFCGKPVALNSPVWCEVHYDKAYNLKGHY